MPGWQKVNLEKFCWWCKRQTIISHNLDFRSKQNLQLPLGYNFLKNEFFLDQLENTTSCYPVLGTGRVGIFFFFFFFFDHVFDKLIMSYLHLCKTFCAIGIGNTRSNQLPQKELKEYQKSVIFWDTLKSTMADHVERETAAQKWQSD